MDYVGIAWLAVWGLAGLGFIIYKFVEEEAHTPRRIAVALIALCVSLLVAGLMISTIDHAERFSPSWFIHVLFSCALAFGTFVMIYGFAFYALDLLRSLAADLPIFLNLGITVTILILLWPLLWRGPIPQGGPDWLKGLFAVGAAGLLAATFWLISNGLFWLRRIIKERVARWRALASGQPYFLMLRSFNNRFNLDAPEGLQITNDFPSIIPGTSIIPRLVQGIKGKNTVVLIGRLSFRHAADAANAVQLRTSEDGWREAFVLLAGKAKGIVVIPSDTDGVVEELETLHHDPALWRKTILFYPPQLESVFLHDAVSNARELEENWPEVISRLAVRGIEVPHYTGKASFSVPATGLTVRITDTDTLRLPSAIRDAFQTIEQELQGESSTFRSAYRSFTNWKRQRARGNHATLDTSHAQKTER